MKEENKGINKLRVGIWFAVGFLCSMIFAAMYISEEGTLDCFYNVGEVYDVFSDAYKYGGTEWNYDALEHNIAISSEEAWKQINIVGKIRNWNFCVIEISYMNRPSMSAIMDCLNTDGTVVASFPVELTEGRNQIFLEGIAFSSFVIKVLGEPGAEFKITDLQLRLQDPDSSIHRIIKLGGFAFFLYLLLSLFLNKIKKKNLSHIHINFYAILEKLQRALCKVANMYGKYFKNTSGKTRRVVWESCFFILIFYTVFVFNTNQHLKMWRYSQVVYTLIVFIIAVFSIEDEIRPVYWKNGLVYSWVMFWILATISDFIVSKDFSGVGMIQIFVWGFCFLIWNNMKHPYKLMRAFMNSVCNSFLTVTIFCLCCRPDVIGGRYMGIFTNPNTFANYLVVVAAVLTADISHMLLVKRNRRMILDCIGLLAVFVFLWKTQTRGAMIAIGVIMLLAGWYLVWEKRKQGYYLLAKWILYMVLLLAPVYTGLSWGIANIPRKLGTVVIMEEDVAVPAEESVIGLGGIKVHAAGIQEKIEQSRIWQTLKRGSLEEISSGRTVFWIAYLRDMNLWGHEGRAKVSGRIRDAHNAFLAIAYRYGVFILIFYIILWGYSMIYGIKYLNYRKHPYGFLPLSLCVSYMIVSLVDAVEQPYVNIIWFAMYFIFGILFAPEGNHMGEGKEDLCV